MLLGLWVKKNVKYKGKFIITVAEQINYSSNALPS